MEPIKVDAVIDPVKVGGAVLLRFRGKVAPHGVKAAESTALQYFDSGDRRFVLKLEEATEADVEGTAEIVALAARLRSKGAAFALAGPFPTQILNALIMHGVNTTVPMFSSAEEAILMVASANPLALPKAQAQFGRVPFRDARRLPVKIRDIYDETFLGLSYGLRVLTAIGIRTLVEAVCKDLEAEGKNLEKRIDNLVDKGHLTKSDAKVLHLTRFLGNRAAHEVEASTLEQLNAALDIVEYLLTGAYVLPDAAAKLPSPSARLGD